MAFDKNRKFKSCVFCGLTPRGKLTAEDLFGTSLADQFPLERQWSTIGADGTVVRGGGPITRVAPRLLCRECNNVRSGKIVNDSLPAMLRLIEGTPHEISPENRVLLHRNLERMALITDVMTSNCQLTAKFRAGKDYRVSAPFRQAPPHYSDAQRKEWIEGRGKLSDMHVYIGFHSGILGLNPDINTVDYAVLSLGIATEPRPPKKVLTTIGNLAVCIWMGEDPPNVPSSFRDLAVDQNWGWPGTVPHVSYEDFFGLYEPAPFFDAVIRLMSNPERCQRVEAYSRQKGYSDIPPALVLQFTQMVMQATVARTLWRRGA